MRADPGQDRGFALLITLWACVLLAFLATTIAAAGRSDTQLAANIRDAAVAEAAADGAVHEAAFRLLAGTAPPVTLAVGSATVALRVEDESGKVNPNLASPELLRAMLVQLGLPRDAADPLATNIAAWRFPRGDDGPAMPGLGAPRPPDATVGRAYRAAGLGYEPPGAPFESLDELGLVLGMTPELLARLRPHLSLLTDTPPDPALASPFVRQALAPPGTGPATPPPGRQAPPRAVTVVAEAVTRSGARFARGAGIRLTPADRNHPVTIATWDIPPLAAAP